MDRLLDDAKRMLLAWRGPKGPVATPMAFWWDGRHLWTTTSGSAGKVRALAEDPECAIYVEPGDGGRDRTGIAMRGRARIYRPDDLVAMVTHGAVVAAANAALAVKNASSVAGYVADVARVPRRWLPDSRVTLRIEVTAHTPAAPPRSGPGIAPALPSEVPAEVRRLVAGRRDVVLATVVDGGVGVIPAIWGAGFTMALPADVRLPTGTRCSAVVHHDSGFRPTEVAGVAVGGTWNGQGIDAGRARWWHGFDHGVVDVTGSPAHRIVIPD